MMFAAAFAMPTGHVLYYTGMAGGEYLSSDITKAFFGYSQTGAMRKAEALAFPRTSGLAAEHKPLAVPMPVATFSYLERAEKPA